MRLYERGCLDSTILTSDSELMERTYIVTPTSTGGPETRSEIRGDAILPIVSAHSVYHTGVIYSRADGIVP